MSTDVKTPQGAASRFSRSVSAACGRWGRPFHAVLSVSVLVGIQVLAAGPAAVATLPSAVMARPFVPASVSSAEPAVFSPQLGTIPGLFHSILEDAFPGATVTQASSREEEEATVATGNPDEMIPFSGRSAPRWLVHSILKAARVTGVDPVYMMTLADVESSLSPEAKASTSTAEGLFQFIDRTWLETVYAHAADYGFAAAAKAIRIVDGEPTVDEKDRVWVLSLRTDPYFSGLMAGELIKDVEQALRAQGERELAEAELYLAHFLGASSAVRFLDVLDKDPNTKAAKLFPQAAKANAALFMDGKGRRRRPVSVAELYNRIDSKIVRRMDRYEDLRPLLAEISHPQRMIEKTVEASALAR